jgi:hypothetical protein
MNGHPVLDQNTRILLRSAEAFKLLPSERAEQAWGGTVPSQICFSAQVQESAIFIAEDWVATIRSRRLIDCVGAMCAVIDTLRQEFSEPIGVELSDTHDSGDTPLYRQLDRERSMRRYGSIGLLVFTIVASGFVGALIQWVF